MTPVDRQFFSGIPFRERFATGRLPLLVPASSKAVPGTDTPGDLLHGSPAFPPSSTAGDGRLHPGTD
jgi:hypothetical protein